MLKCFLTSFEKQSLTEIRLREVNVYVVMAEFLDCILEMLLDNFLK
jgi:hypothetical protein